MTFKLIGNELVGQPEMEYPSQTGFYEFDPKQPDNIEKMGFNQAAFNKYCEDYEAHLKSLPRYTVLSEDIAYFSTKEVWEEDEIITQEQFWTGSDWWPTYHLVDSKPKPGTKTRIIAHPAKPKQESQPVADSGKAETITDKGIKELEQALIDILYEANGTGSGAADIVEYLKKNYFISAKRFINEKSTK